MERPIIRIHNAATDEIVDRPMNDEEFIKWQSEQRLEAEFQAEKLKIQSEKTALLKKLGITEEEAKLLLS